MPSPSRTAFGLCPLGFLDLSPPELVTQAARAGFASVTVRTRPAVPGGPAYPMQPGDALFEHTRRCVQDTGVAVQMVEQVGLSRDTQAASLRPMLEAGRALGATRVLCSGDDVDFALVAERFAALCDLAAEHGMSADMEFMKFRAVQTLEDALQVLRLAGRPNGRVVVDALHLFRSGGGAENVRAAPAALISSVQLCDAPLASPGDDQLAQEARQARLPIGEGELPLRALLDATPDGALVEVEVPFGDARAGWPVERRLALLAESTRRFLAGHLGEASAA